MTHVNQATTGGFVFVTKFAALRETLSRRAAQYAAYRTTLVELRKLSLRELDDLGLSAGDLHKIAHEAAYK